MDFGIFLRNKVFWILDALKGNKIRKHYNDIAFLNQNNNTAGSLKRQKGLIIELLTHTTDSVPFYKTYKDFKGIESFPVIKKTTIQNDFDNFKSNLFLDKKLHKVSTSGSTGIPFELFWNKNKKVRNSADTLYFLERAGYKVGHKLFYLGIYRSSSFMDPLMFWIRNIKHFRIQGLDKIKIQAILKNLSKGGKKNILGYASCLEGICKYLDEEPHDLSRIEITSIISFAEYINKYTRNSLETYFNTKVVSRYSSQELGIIAQQVLDEDTNHFKVNWASFYTEILKMDIDIPAVTGEIGRIVITDLFNYSMPLIRYDTGDLGFFSEPTSSKNPFPDIARIEGRRSDMIYDTKGNQVSPHFVNQNLYEFSKLFRQYQFVQTGEKEYLIKLNTYTGNFDSNDNLLKTLKKLLGIDAIITIQLVDEMPIHDSGKRQMIKNEYS